MFSNETLNMFVYRKTNTFLTFIFLNTMKLILFMCFSLKKIQNYDILLFALFLIVHYMNDEMQSLSSYLEVA